MATLNTGPNEVTSGTRASQEFDFNGGRLGIMITDIASTAPDWDCQVKMPDATWSRVSSQQIDSNNRFRSYTCPAGTYRMYCDTNTPGDFTPVKIYWYNVPMSMRDAALY